MHPYSDILVFLSMVGAIPLLLWGNKKIREYYGVKNTCLESVVMGSIIVFLVCLSTIILLNMVMGPTSFLELLTSISQALPPIKPQEA